MLPRLGHIIWESFQNADGSKVRKPSEIQPSTRLVDDLNFDDDELSVVLINFENAASSHLGHRIALHGIIEVWEVLQPGFTVNDLAIKINEMILLQVARIAQERVAERSYRDIWFPPLPADHETALSRAMKLSRRVTYIEYLGAGGPGVPLIPVGLALFPLTYPMYSLSTPNWEFESLKLVLWPFYAADVELAVTFGGRTNTVWIEGLRDALMRADPAAAVLPGFVQYEPLKSHGEPLLLSPGAHLKVKEWTTVDPTEDIDEVDVIWLDEELEEQEAVDYLMQCAEDADMRADSTAAHQFAVTGYSYEDHGPIRGIDVGEIVPVSYPLWVAVYRKAGQTRVSSIGRPKTCLDRLDLTAATLSNDALKVLRE